MAVKTSENKPAAGLEPNMAAALCYAPFVGWVGAIILLVLSKEQTVRWHAVQALLFSVAIMVVISIMRATIILLILSPIVWVAAMIVQLVLVVKTYQGEKVKLPGLGEWTDRLVKKA